MTRIPPEQRSPHIRRIRTPADQEALGVAGFDNIFGSDFTTPTLTTVEAPVGDLASAGVDAVLALAEDGVAADVPALRSSVVVRESTAAHRA